MHPVFSSATVEKCWKSISPVVAQFSTLEWESQHGPNHVTEVFTGADAQKSFVVLDIKC